MPVLATTRRISVVGPSGSGKSQLSQTLARLLGLPLYQLDQLQLGPSGCELSQQEFIAAVSEIAAGDEWVIDGHYRDVRHLIWGRAQTVIWLNYPPLIVGWRLIRRNLRKKLARLTASSGQPATSITAASTGDVKSASWRMRWPRVKKTLRERKEFGSLLHSSNYSDLNIVELRSFREVEEWKKDFEHRMVSESIPSQTAEKDRPEEGRLLGVSQGCIGKAKFKPAPPITIFVELFGLPGAGKTTLTDAVGEAPYLKTRFNIADEWAAQSYWRQSGYVVRTLVDLPLVVSAVRLAIGARLTNPESLWRLIRLVIMKHWWLTRPGLLLFDQGALQSLWSVLYTSGRTQPNPKVISPLVRLFFEGMRTQIILIEVDKKVAARRIIARTNGSSRFDGLPLERVDSQIALSTSLVYTIIEAARVAGIDVRTFNGSEPTSVLAEKLQELLDSHQRDIASIAFRLDTLNQM